MMCVTNDGGHGAKSAFAHPTLALRVRYKLIQNGERINGKLYRRVVLVSAADG
jgi:hypothetical protein